MLMESQKARECDGALVCVAVRDGTVHVGHTALGGYLTPQYA
jgi:hypothetical protein